MIESTKGRVRGISSPRSGMYEKHQRGLDKGDEKPDESDIRKFEDHLESLGLGQDLDTIEQVVGAGITAKNIEASHIEAVSQALPSEEKRLSWLSAVEYAKSEDLQSSTHSEDSKSSGTITTVANIVKKFASSRRLNTPQNLDAVRRVDAHFRIVAMVNVGVWLLLLAIVVYLTPSHKFVRLEGIELSAAMLASGIMFFSWIGKFTPYLHSGDKKLSISGAFVAALSVQGVAFVTDGIMASGIPTPVLTDPVLGTRIHLLRWCEWAPAAFALAFLTTGIDFPDSRTTLKRNYHFSARLGIATSMGLCFGLAPNKYAWCTMLITAVVLFSEIYYELYRKWRVFRNTKKGASIDEIEHYDRIRLAYRLLATCSATWTLLVAAYFVAGLGLLFAPQRSILKNEWVGMVWESLMDVLSKNLYLSIILDVHKLVFDDAERAERRLAELRRLMSAVWESSSDVICISVRGMSGTVTTLVSPSYTRMFCGRENPKKATALVFDLEQEAFGGEMNSDQVEPRVIHRFDFNVLSELRAIRWKDASRKGHDEGPTLEIASSQSKEELSSLAKLIVSAWNCDEAEALLMHDLLKKTDEKKVVIPGEASVNRLEDNALVVVVRDVSERFERFEAEKKVITEATARKKDEEANRFTRHEVKNGLLAAIGLCDSLKDSVQNAPENQMIGDVPQAPASKSFGIEGGNGTKADATRCTKELDKTLRDVLDTVMSEAMARDVIHGVYQPKLACVDVNELLSSLHVAKVKHDRFPIVQDPSPIPLLVVDPQLLKYIHRNALSNACKYGKRGGVVTTKMCYDNERKLFVLDVINMPGEFHDEMLRLGKEAWDEVFSKGTRFHHKFKQLADVGASLMHSSGDGAWIMKKCALTLNGSVAISFEADRTIFRFQAPALRYDETTVTRKAISNFQLPPHTWGIAIDDSKIQRKLLDRFFMFLGVEASRRIILGGTADEIRGFDDLVVQLIEQNPLEKFVLIVDENLDIEEDETRLVTISGSVCIENILRRLLPNQERRLLALVRSANDSAQDTALYNSRAHGYIPKAPINKKSVCQTIAPLWEDRFQATTLEFNRKSVLVSDEPSASDSEDSTDIVSSEVRTYLAAIDEVCTLDVSALPERWPYVWEKLLALKGDLLTSIQTSGASAAIAEINLLNRQKLPHDFVNRWGSLRSLVLKCLEDRHDNLSDGGQTRKKATKTD